MCETKHCGKKPIIDGDEVVCPCCGARDCITYAQDVPEYYDVEVVDGELVATGMGTNGGVGCDNSRVFCTKCNEYLDHDGIDIV